MTTSKSKPKDQYKEKPVNEEEEHVVKIIGIGEKGDGIARIQNFVIVIPNTTKGEEYKVKINNVYSTFAVAEVIK